MVLGVQVMKSWMFQENPNKSKYICIHYSRVIEIPGKCQNVPKNLPVSKDILRASWDVSTRVYIANVISGESNNLGYSRRVLEFPY